MNRFTLKNFAMLVLALASLAACAPAKNASTSVRPGAGTPVDVSGTFAVVRCHETAGRIYATGPSAAGFDSRVKDLLSANAASTSFGSIDGSATSTQTCVGLDGHLALDSSGNINAASSSMKISIYDSLAASGAEIAYLINFTKATSASSSGNRHILKFEDDFGLIQFTIDVANGTSSGTVSFQNYKHVDNLTPASGVLGTIAIPTASLMN